jgi:hypothetical protein
MPIGVDASQFVNNFLNAYYMGKQFDEESKRRKYEPIIASVMEKIKSPDTTYSEKTALTKSLFNVMGIKTDESVSQLFSEIEKQDNKLIEERKPKNPYVPTTIGEEGFTDIKEAQQKNVNLGDKSVGNVFNQIEGQSTRRGDLTPLEYEDIIKEKAESRRFPRELQRQKEIIKLKSEAELNEYKAKGYKEVGLFKDKNGDWFYSVLNPFTKDEQRAYLPQGATPESIVKEQNKALNRNTGLVGSAKNLAWAYTIKGKQEDDPNSVTPQEISTANDIIKNQRLGEGIKEATTTALQQGNTGTRLPSPAQVIDDERAREELGIRKTEIDVNTEKELTEATTEAEAYTNQAVELRRQLAAIAAQLAPGKVNAETKEQLLKDKSRIENELRDVESKAAQAFGKGTAAAKAKQVRSGSNQNSNTQYNATQLQAIDLFKNQNANNPKLAGLSDSQILQLIQQAQGRKKSIRRR